MLTTIPNFLETEDQYLMEMKRELWGRSNDL